jgi:predicted nicotinamide N-methyase
MRRPRALPKPRDPVPARPAADHDGPWHALRLDRAWSRPDERAGTSSDVNDVACMTKQHRASRSTLEVPRALPLSRRRSLVAHHTRLRAVAGVAGVRLHLADDLDPVWQATEEALGTEGAPIPFWAFAWAGGLALARYVQEHPDEVAGLRVLDFGTGSGLVAIAAAQAGATQVIAADVDPFAEAAVGMNTRANGIHLAYVRRDLLQEPPPVVDVLLAADTWYEGPLAERVLPWLRSAAAHGTRVLVGDPGRKYLPASGFTELARYDVRTTTTLEDHDVVEARVFTLA